MRNEGRIKKKLAMESLNRSLGGGDRKRICSFKLGRRVIKSRICSFELEKGAIIRPPCSFEREFGVAVGIRCEAGKSLGSFIVSICEIKEKNVLLSSKRCKSKRVRCG